MLSIGNRQKSTKTEEKGRMSDDLVVKVKASANQVNYKAIFTYDSKYLIVPSDKNIKVLSTSTSECIQQLIGHKSTVVSIQQNPKIQVQIFSCSADGQVISWDYEDGVLLKVYDMFVSPITAFYVPCKDTSWFVTVKGKDIHCLFKISFDDQNRLIKRFILKPVLPNQNQVAFGKQGEFVAGVCENELRVFSFANNTFKRHMTGTKKLTSVVCHPSDYILATGDEIGQILVWYEFLTSNQPSKSVYHWHTLPVGDLMFSAEGSYLFSGGGECTLTKWNVETDIKHFLPRMGYPIRYISVSPNNMFIATSHIDNVIYLINAQLKVCQVFQGITQSYLLGLKWEFTSYILARDPKTQAIVLVSKPGHLQFYDPHSDHHMFSMDIVGENYLSQERKKKIINTNIDTVAFDSQGKWLVTVECRDDNETSLNIRMKFWKFESEKQKYVLNTNIFLPHAKRINCVQFQPSDDTKTPLAVSVAKDKLFKLWTISKSDEDDENKESWNCISLGYYHDLEASASTFSEDGSILAVAFEHIITLWDPETNTSLNTLYEKGKDEAIQQLLFGQESCSYLLVCSTKSNVTVWNILNLTVSWKIQVDVACLATDPMSDMMSVFNTEGTLFIFRPDNPNPIFIRKDASTKPVITALFVPRKITQDDEGWQKYSQLYYMNEDQELLTLAKEVEHILTNMPKQMKDMPATPFAKLIAEQRKFGQIEQYDVDHSSEGIVGDKAYTMMMNVSSHIMPPASVLCYNFLLSMISPLKKDSTNEQEGKSSRKEELTDNIAKTYSSPEIRRADNTSTNLKSVLLENYDWLINS